MIEKKYVSLHRIIVFRPQKLTINNNENKKINKLFTLKIYLMKRRFLFLLMAVCSFVGANAAINRANNYLQAADVKATQGQTVDVALTMVNKTFDIINWQTELVLPEGVTFVSATPADRWTEAIQVDGVKLFSETETAVAKGEGVVAKITLKVDASVAAGEYDLALKGVVMTAADGTSIAQVENKGFKLTVEEAHGKKGDLTGDGEVNAADIQALLNIIASGEKVPEADLTGDGDINAGDIQALLNIIAEQ